MAIPKAVQIAAGVAMVGVGIWQISNGIKGCNGHDLDWGSTRAGSVDVGDFTVKIPAGWRDASEANDSKMKELLAKQPGAHVLVRQNFDGETVMVKAGPNEPLTGKPPCEEIAKQLGAMEGSTPKAIAEQAFGGDPGCHWVATKGELSVQYNLRFRGAQVFLVACSSGTGAGCQQTLDGVTAKK